MSSDHPNGDSNQALPGESSVPLIHVPPTPEQLRAESERQNQQREKEAEASYKDRQITLTESNLKLSSRTFNLTIALAIFTAVGAGAASYQGYIAHRSAIASEISANAAKSASDTAASQLELSERPWITIDAKIGSSLFFGTDGGRIEFLYDLKNIGNSPAMKVWKNDEIYVVSPAKPSEISERDRFCLETSRSSGKLGHTVFPKDFYQERTSVPISRDQINSTRADFGKAYGIKAFPFLSSYLITCVAYSPSFNPSTRYYTGIIYDLQKRSAESPTGVVSLKVDENLPASEIVMTQSMVAGTLAQ